METVFIYFTHLDREPLRLEGATVTITETPTGFKITNDQQTDEMYLPSEGVIIIKQIKPILN